MADYSWDDILETAGEKFNILPEGEYAAVIKEATATVSKKSGNDMVACTVKVAEGPHAGKGVKTVYVSKPGPGTTPEKLDGAVNMFMRHLKAVGITFDSLKTHKPTMAQIASVMVGKRVTIKVEHEEYPKGSGDRQAANMGPLRPPAEGAAEVTSFPPVTATTVPVDVQQGGYTTDPGF